MLEQFRANVIAIWRGRGVPQEWRDAIIIVLHKKKDRTECGHSWHLARDTLWQGSPQGNRQSSEQVLRTGRYPARGTVRLQTATVDNLYDLSGPTTSPTGAKREHLSVNVFRRPHQRIQFSRPDSRVGRARSVPRSTEDARGYSSLPRWNASVHPDG